MFPEGDNNFLRKSGNGSSMLVGIKLNFQSNNVDWEIEHSLEKIFKIVRRNCFLRFHETQSGCEQSGEVLCHLKNSFDFFKFFFGF